MGMGLYLGSEPFNVESVKDLLVQTLVPKHSFVNHI